MLITLLGVVLALLGILTAYIKWNHQYWKRRGVPYAQPAFPMGNIKLPGKDTGILGDQIKKVYDQTRQRGWKHCGIYLFSRPFYMPLDLDYARNILTKDFQYFTERGAFYNEKDDPLTAHLFALGGTRWRNLRKKVTPTFSAGKMKMMFQTVLDNGVALNQVMYGLHRKGEPVDIKEILARFTTNNISSCAFGLDSNCFLDDDAPLRKYGKKLLEFSLMRAIKLMFTAIYPELSCTLGFRFVPVDVAEFFMNVVKDTLKYREINQIRRDDFLQLLIELKKEDGLTMNELAAQCFVFYLGGFETSSTTLSFLLYEMARNQDVQNRLRKEINEVLARFDNKVTYEAIGEMKYLEKIIYEGLRMYPPAPIFTRKCVAPYPVPDSDVILEEGTMVMVPVLGYHMDPAYYPNPEKFDPERFNEKNKSDRHPYAYLAFGGGPRTCIGTRFGLMQMKVGLTSLIRNYHFTVNQRTKDPLEFDSRTLVPSAAGGIWLNVGKVEQ